MIAIIAETVNYLYNSCFVLYYCFYCHVPEDIDCGVIGCRIYKVQAISEQKENSETVSSTTYGYPFLVTTVKELNQV